MSSRDELLRPLTCIASEGMLTMTEAQWVHDTVSRHADGQPLNYLEVGVWVGRSFYAAATALPNGSAMVAIDTFRGLLPDFDNNKYDAEFGGVGGSLQKRMFDAVGEEIAETFGHDVQALDGLSHQMGKYLGILGEKFDVLLLDADHQYDSVKRDIEAFLPVLSPGALIMAHDFNNPEWPGVRKAFNEKFGVNRMQGVHGTRFGVMTR